MKILLRKFAVEMLQKSKELDLGMGIKTSSIYDPFVNEQRSKRARRTMPGISMGLAFCPV
jgi:hypothetical protein